MPELERLERSASRLAHELAHDDCAQHEPDHRKGSEPQRERCNLAQDARPKALQVLIDQRRQHGVAAGDSEQRWDAEIADRRHERERRTGEDRRQRHRQDHRASDPQRTSTAKPRRLDEVAWQVAQARLHRKEDER